MKQTTLITGYFGSGKSEFAINYALWLKSLNKEVVLADLDIINPYFRSVEASLVLKQAGVDVLSTSFEGQMDLPAVPGQVFSLFNSPDSYRILDLGGDEEGARILGYLGDLLKDEDFDFWCCLNANRSETDTLEKAINLIKRIETSSKQKITGIVNTTHLMNYTTSQDIKAGCHLAKEVSESLNLPIIYNVVHKPLVYEVSDIDNIFEIDIYLKKPWEV